MPRALVWLALAVAACQPARSPHVRRAGIVMSVGGVVGIMGSAVASSSTERAAEAMVGFQLLSAVGIILYAAHEMTAPEAVFKPETRRQKHHRWAKILTEHAAGAARSGNCARVRKFEPRVRIYDPEVHDFVFMRDPEILRCLSQAPAVRADGEVSTPER